MATTDMSWMCLKKLVYLLFVLILILQSRCCCPKKLSAARGAWTRTKGCGWWNHQLGSWRWQWHDPFPLDRNDHWTTSGILKVNCIEAIHLSVSFLYYYRLHLRTGCTVWKLNVAPSTQKSHLSCGLLHVSTWMESITQLVMWINGWC